MTYQKLIEHTEQVCNASGREAPAHSGLQYIVVMSNWGKVMQAVIQPDEQALKKHLGLQMHMMQALALQNGITVRWAAHEQEALRKVSNLKGDEQQKRFAYAAQASGMLGFLGMHNYGVYGPFGGNPKTYLSTHLREAVREVLAFTLAAGLKPQDCIQTLFGAKD